MEASGHTASLLRVTDRAVYETSITQGLYSARRETKTQHTRYSALSSLFHSLPPHGHSTTRGSQQTCCDVQ